MPQSPTSSMQQARLALAERLRELRLDAGITGRELAVRCGWSESKSSRIENAKTAPSDTDIRAWSTACGAADQAPDLIAANRQAGSMYVQWRRLQRTGLRRLQESSIGLYESTRRFHVYCSNVIPGFLQTPGYATALLTSIAAFRGTPDDVLEAAKARMRRSRVVHEGDHTFAVLVEETVLRYNLANPEIMSGQLGHLLSVMSLPSVSLGVVPSSRNREHAIWPLETFTVFDTRRVHTELLSAAVTVTAPSEVALYLKAFEQMSHLAVHGAEARALILKAIEAL